MACVTFGDQAWARPATRLPADPCQLRMRCGFGRFGHGCGWAQPSHALEILEYCSVTASWEVFLPGVALNSFSGSKQQRTNRFCTKIAPAAPMLPAARFFARLCEKYRGARFARAPMCRVLECGKHRYKTLSNNGCDWCPCK